MAAFKPVAGREPPQQADNHTDPPCAFCARQGGQYAGGAARRGIIAHYGKLHLYDAFNMQESARVDAGHEIAPLIDVDGMKVGLMTCYDLRFPELALSLALQGQTFWRFLLPGFGARSKSGTGRRCWLHEHWTRPVISLRQGNVAIRILA
jgi:hypothetical protein